MRELIVIAALCLLIALVIVASVPKCTPGNHPVFNLTKLSWECAIPSTTIPTDDTTIDVLHDILR